MKYYMKNKRKNCEQPYHSTFLDMMAGLLIIFLLLFIFELLQVKGGGGNGNGINVAEYYTTGDNKKYDELIKKEKETIGKIQGTRTNIVSKLKYEFQGKGIQVTVNDKTGVIRLSEDILFDYGKSDLKEEGKEFLQSFIPIYLNTLFSDNSIKNDISEIIVEGHTDTVSTYLYNLKLSQERAYSVCEYILSDEINYNYKDELQNKLTANGRSYSDAIKNSDGTINADASRRVEIKFRLKEEEALINLEREIAQYNK